MSFTVLHLYIWVEFLQLYKWLFKLKIPDSQEEIIKLGNTVGISLYLRTFWLFLRKMPGNPIRLFCQFCLSFSLKITSNLPHYHSFSMDSPFSSHSQAICKLFHKGNNFGYRYILPLDLNYFGTVVHYLCNLFHNQLPANAEDMRLGFNPWVGKISQHALTHDRKSESHSVVSNS